MAAVFALTHRRTDARLHPWQRVSILLPAAIVVVTSAWTSPAAVDSGPKRWTDDELVASYGDLASGGGLETAVRTPALPKDPPQSSFLKALAWYAAGMPKGSGVLTIEKLDEQIANEVAGYIRLLKSRVKSGEENDYARTRTWKLIQKYTLLRDAMSQPERKGRFEYDALGASAGASGADAWERDHTLRSPEEFAEKVCRASYDRPVLVKYGNTNCTQCMLFEIIGSVRDFAESPAHRGKVEVYKVWWGYRPDDSFAGRIRDPQRLDELAKAEGARSSPYFIAYRNGRRYPCGDAFPDDSGRDEKLESCLDQEFGEAPVSSACESAGSAGRPRAGGR